jgi:hypothetical protein
MRNVIVDTVRARLGASFQTAEAKYAWINRIVAIGIGHRRGDGPIYSVFEVL